MPRFGGKVAPSGDLRIKVIRAPRTPSMEWRIKNALRWGHIAAWIGQLCAVKLSRVTGILTVHSELKLTKIFKSGRRIPYGVVSRRVVTDVGVAFIVDDWDDDTTNITDLNWHGIGTGSAAEDQTDTALGTEVETRVSGTKSQPAANQLKTVGTITATAQRLLREHGIFSAVSAGTLWDRSVYALITLEIDDAIQCEYTATLTAGS